MRKSTPKHTRQQKTSVTHELKPPSFTRVSHLNLSKMKVSFGAFVIAAGICGMLSFAFLATSLGTDYWYIIEMNPMNISDFENMSSHSGLWSINEGRLPLFLTFASKC